jgi:hypothetical protein
LASTSFTTSLTPGENRGARTFGFGSAAAEGSVEDVIAPAEAAQRIAASRHTHGVPTVLRGVFITGPLIELFHYEYTTTVKMFLD